VSKPRFGAEFEFCALHDRSSIRGHGSGWQNKIEGNKRASNISPTKAKAQAKGREMAKERHTEHKIQNQKGQIAERNSYGRHPYPPKG
jgi:hypothetical protein